MARANFRLTSTSTRSLPSQTFPFYLEWVTKPPEERNLLDKALCLATVTSLQFIPLVGVEIALQLPSRLTNRCS